MCGSARATQTLSRYRTCVCRSPVDGHGDGEKVAKSSTAASNRGRQHGQLDQDYARIRVHGSNTTTVTHDQAIGSPRLGMAIAELTGGDTSTTGPSAYGPPKTTPKRVFLGRGTANATKGPE